MSYTITKGIPIPSNRLTNSLPLAKMDTGDSIDVKKKEMKLGTISSRLWTYHKKNPGIRFVTRQVTGRGRTGKMTRIWRVK
jgi:hypothetical protein